MRSELSAPAAPFPFSPARADVVALDLSGVLATRIVLCGVGPFPPVWPWPIGGVCGVYTGEESVGGISKKPLPTNPIPALLIQLLVRMRWGAREAK